MTRRTKSMWASRKKFSGEGTLEDYLEWFLENGSPIPQMPKDGYENIGNGPYVVLHREGQYQSQLFFVNPSEDLPVHNHPNVNSYELHVGGDIDFIVEDESAIPYAHLMDEKDGISRFWAQGVHVPAGCDHYLKVGRAGGVFVSVQHWLNGIKPTSVDFDWVGDPMDERHLEGLTHNIEGVDYIAGQLCD
jgi:hypothetical protein